MRQRKHSSNTVLLKFMLIIIAIILFTISFFIKSIGIKYKIILNVVAECLIALFLLVEGTRILKTKRDKALGVMFIISFIIISVLIAITLKNIL